MNKFKVGDKVVIVDARGGEWSKVGMVLTIKSQGASGYRPDYCRFEERWEGLFAERLMKAEDKPEHDDLLDALSLAVAAEMADPNDEMLTEDENEEKAKEFDAIMRERDYERLLKELRSGPAVEREKAKFWDGEHLSNAIDKTVSGAQHPQAMWGL